MCYLRACSIELRKYDIERKVKFGKIPPIYWQHERTYGLNMIISTFSPFGEILSQKRFESPHFLNMIKIKDKNFALNFFLIFDK